MTEPVEVFSWKKQLEEGTTDLTDNTEKKMNKIWVHELNTINIQDTRDNKEYA